MSTRNNRQGPAAPAIPNVEDTDEFRRNGDLPGPNATMTNEQIRELAVKMADKAHEVLVGYFTGILMRSTRENRAYVLVDVLSELTNERNFRMRQHLESMPESRQAACRGFIADHIRNARNLAGRHVKFLPVAQTTGERRQTPVGDETQTAG